MEEDNSEVSETVRKAANRLRRRKDRNKPNTNLLEMLKQSREAAGKPLNPVKEAVAVQSETPDGEKEGKQFKPDQKQDTPTQFIDIDPWQETPSPDQIKDSDQGQASTFSNPNQTDLGGSIPQQNLQSISGVRH